MNSQSNGNCSGTAGAATPCPNPCPPRFIQCTSPDVDLHPAPCPALLECGEGFDPAVTQSAGTGGTTIFNPSLPVKIAEVEIDTTCLCFPNLKIEFSTLIDTTASGGTPNLVIQLTRTCTNGATKNLKTYTINLAAGGNTNTIPFSFVFCAENVPSRDCTYTVSLITAAIGNNNTVSFSSTNIAALAVGCQRLC